ncbi:hypothetical protein BH23GEM6_BH23GEM6_23980 [soil metagenome]
MAPERRDNLIGRELGLVLQPITRDVLSSAEAVFRAPRNDARFDFSGPVIKYGKAWETELNALHLPWFAEGAAYAAATGVRCTGEGRVLDLAGMVPHQTLGVLKNLLQHSLLVCGQIGSSLGPTGYRVALQAAAGPAGVSNPAPEIGCARRAQLAPGGGCGPRRDSGNRR